MTARRAAADRLGPLKLSMSTEVSTMINRRLPAGVLRPSSLRERGQFLLDCLQWPARNLWDQLVKGAQ